jgi:hypothetical protein
MQVSEEAASLYQRDPSGKPLDAVDATHGFISIDLGRNLCFCLAVSTKLI